MRMQEFLQVVSFCAASLLLLAVSSPYSSTSSASCKSDKAEVEEEKAEKPPSYKPKLVIEFCNKCKWGLRATWMAAEIIQTFGDNLSRIELQPSSPGTYRILVEDQVVWDRKIDNEFPYPKDIKLRLQELCWFKETDLGKCIKTK